MMCVCVGYGCVCFLWVCGILAHNSCSSQVTAPFSRTYLAFLPRHDYHTPSTPFFWLCRIFPSFPEWNWSHVPEMNNSPPAPLYSLLFIPPVHPVSLPPHCLLILFASSTDSCCLAIGILCYKPFPP